MPKMNNGRNAEKKSKRIPPNVKIIQGFETAFLESAEKGEPSLWIFGYGSLIWNPGFKFAESIKAKLPGYSRRFFQGNTNWRGTPELVSFSTFYFAAFLYYTSQSSLPYFLQFVSTFYSGINRPNLIKF